MIWDLVQLVLLALFMLAYIAVLYQENVLLRHRERVHRHDCQVIDAQRRLLEAKVEHMEIMYRERHELYEDINSLMGDVLNREKERDYWKNRALSLQRQLYHGEFFEEE